MPHKGDVENHKISKASLMSTKSTQSGLDLPFRKVTNSITLVFKESAMEYKYQEHIIRYRINVGRIGSITAFIVATTYYVWSLATKPADFERVCKEEPSNCRVYSKIWDLCLYLIAACLPSIFLIASTFKRNLYVKFSEYFINITILFLGIGNFCLAEYGNGPKEPYRIALPLIIFVFASHFIYRSCFMSTLVHFCIFAAIFCITQLSQLSIKSGNEIVFSIIYFAISGALLCLVSYGQEFSSRSQFYENFKINHRNKELLMKMDNLQKGYLNKGLNDLLSPLEKATNLLKLLMSETSRGSIHYNLLENILELIHGPNIMVPDFKGHFPTGSRKIDDDTEVRILIILGMVTYYFVEEKRFCQT